MACQNEANYGLYFKDIGLTSFIFLVVFTPELARKTITCGKTCYKKRLGIKWLGIIYDIIRFIWLDLGSDCFSY